MAKTSRFKLYLASYNFLGLVLGTLFVYTSFLPSLLPRGWVLQGVISGVVFTAWYGIGMIISHYVRKSHLKELPADQKSYIRNWTFPALGVGYAVALIVGYNWQIQVNQLVGQSFNNYWWLIGTPIVSLLIIAFIMLVARSIRSLYVWLGRLIAKKVPKWLAYSVAWIGTLLIVWGILSGFLVSNAMSALNTAFSAKNDTTDAGIVQPTNQHQSGGPESLIAWDTLGRQGRKFVGKAKTPQQLAAFSHLPAMVPVRIYSGIKSGTTAAERAQLAAEDLKRAGGYKRKIIVVVTTTGTGWVDEQGVDPVEYMYNGDSAIVAMQYSYLPSWLSFLVDKSKAKEAGIELYNAVYDQWLKLPADQRPKIVVFGESLGSFGSEAAFPTKAAFQATSNGAVWVGPPHSNSSWQQVTANRDTGSPEILPVVNNGQIVRFANLPADLKKPGSDWQHPRATYLQNPSDPIVWWSPYLIWQQPDWLKEPRGADVSPATRWLPWVTFWQVTGDMVFSTGVPDGHGHNYGTLPTNAWSQVAPPTGWTDQKTEALTAELGS